MVLFPEYPLIYEKSLEYMTPGGERRSLPSNIFGTPRDYTSDKEERKRVERIIRSCKRAFIEREPVHNTTHTVILAAVGRARGVPDSEIRRFESFLSGLEERSYPLGMYGFILSELLPQLDWASWLVSTLNFDVELTLKFRRQVQESSTNQLPEILAQSDAARTQTGQQMLDLFGEQNDTKIRQIATVGLAYLTLYKYLSCVLTGPDISEEELSYFAGLLSRRDDETCVAMWFKSLREHLELKGWKVLDDRLRTALQIERNHNIEDSPDRSERPGTRISHYRDGRKPVRYDQCYRLIHSLRRSQDGFKRLDKANAVRYYQSYCLAVLTDNMYCDMYRDSRLPSELQDLLPNPDFGDAFIVMNKLAKCRWEAAR